MCGQENERDGSLAGRTSTVPLTSSCITTATMTSHYITPGKSEHDDVPSNEPLPSFSGLQRNLPSSFREIESGISDEQEEGGEGRRRRLLPWVRLSLNDLHILKATER